MGVFLISIPDYSVTPFAQHKNPAFIEKQLISFNEVCEAQAKKFQIPFYQITEISKKAASDKSLLAKDNLHPSAKMYKLWISEILPQLIQDCLAPLGYETSK
jgi:lysophospholipase L1-like esterase